MIINLSYLGDITATNISKSIAHKMAAKTGWQRCGTKLRHYHPMYSQIKGRLLRRLFSESTHKQTGAHRTDCCNWTAETVVKTCGEKDGKLDDEKGTCARPVTILDY